jgi:hypothetical protein
MHANEIVKSGQHLYHMTPGFAGLDVSTYSLSRESPKELQ